METHNTDAENGRNGIFQPEKITCDLPGMLFTCRGDLDLSFIVAFGHIRQITGFSSQKNLLTNKPSFKQLIHPLDWASTMLSIKNAIDKNGDFQKSFRVITKSEEPKWVLAAGIVVQCDSGIIIKGIIHDISLQKQAEQILARLSRIVAAVHSISQSVIKCGSVAKLLKDSCRALTESKAYIFSRIALISNDTEPVKGYESEYHNSNSSQTREMDKIRLTRIGQKAFSKSITILGNKDFSYRQKTRSALEHTFIAPLTIGAKTYGLISVSSAKGIIIDTDEQQLIIEIATDIAHGLDRFNRIREFEKRITRSDKETLGYFMEHSPVGIAIIRDDAIVYSNIRAKSLLRLFQNNLKLTELHSIHKDDKPRFIAAYADFINNRTATMYTTFRIAEKEISDKYFWVSCRINHVKHDNQDEYIASFNDITPLKESEEHFRILDKMATLGQLSSEIAHEIRNPLSIININTNTLLQLCTDIESPEIAEKILLKIKAASNNVENTIKRILAMSKSHQADFALKNINTPVAGAVDLCSDIFTRKNIIAELDLTENLPPCYIDSDLIQQIIINLLSNSVDALARKEGDRRIRIMTAKEDNYNIIRVSDSGTGIPSDLRRKIFNPFFSTKTEGTGIGLNLCHRHVELHNGKISVSDSEWGGAEFTITIPLERRTVPR